MTDFTVAIPTYNGAERLSGVLEKLQAQVETESIAWEILVVDNNSSDNTAEVVRGLQSRWNYPFPLKYCFEPQQGLAFARQRALEESGGEFIGFLDDDNFPMSNWVERAYSFGKKYPRAGAFGGKILADFEVPPPENFDKISGFLAIRDRGSKVSLYQPEILSLPPGAGLVIRKQVWRDCVPKKKLFIGRSGNSLVGGEDWEPLIYMHRAGWEIWYNPEMQIEHQIPSTRLERDYLLSLIHYSCLCFFPLRMIVAKTSQKPLILARTVLGNSYKAALYFLQHQQELETNLVAACELQIYLSRIASPFYFFKNNLLN